MGKDETYRQTDRHVCLYLYTVFSNPPPPVSLFFLPPQQTGYWCSQAGWPLSIPPLHIPTRSWVSSWVSLSRSCISLSRNFLKDSSWSLVSSFYPNSLSFHCFLASFDTFLDPFHFFLSYLGFIFSFPSLSYPIGFSDRVVGLGWNLHAIIVWLHGAAV